MSLENLVRICAALDVGLASLWPSEIQRPALPVSNGSLSEMAAQARALLPALADAEDVAAAVIEAFGISEAEFRSGGRRSDLAAARGCAAVLVHERPHLTLAEMGRLAGVHLTALCHRRRDLERRKDPEVERRLQAAREKLLALEGK